MDILYIIVPAYNESYNIKNFIDEWYPIVETHNGNGKSRLVIINDGSTDDTYDILLSLSKNKPLLVPLTKPNGGHGPTLLFGYKYAINNSADFIFQTDSDGQTNPKEFEQFWDYRYEFDAIIGNRNDRKDGLSRVFVEAVLLLILRFCFGVKLPDSNAPFRLMKSSLISKYIDKLPEDFNIPNVLFTTFFSYYHESLKFIDISFMPRTAGKSSINFKKMFQIGIKALKDFSTIKKSM